MSIQADSKATANKRPVKRAGLLHRLARRYDARRRLHARIPWLGYMLMTLNLVVMAFLVFDIPLGETQRDLSPRLIALAGAVTDIGRLAWILAAAIVVLIVGPIIFRRLYGIDGRARWAHLARMIVYVGISVLSASIVVHLLKYAIGRARPPLYGQYGVFGFEPFNGAFLFQSFPSAHSAHVGALFVALALLFPRLRLIFIGLGLWLGVTRIIIGVHYPSDVAAGLALGAWIAFAIAIIFSRFGLVFSVGQSGWPTPRLRHGLRRPSFGPKSVKNL